MPDAAKNAKDLFLAAVEMASLVERQAFLEQACAGDAVLRRRVEALLNAHDASGDLIDKPAVACEPTGAYPAISEKPGTVIGHYKLMEQIGEGGFGLVFVAEQTEPVRRKVALKIIKPGMDSKAVIARFEAERQALALMDHPNIARVLDAGATESGRPYFVMELVRGIPITEYCDQNQLTPNERLQLFIDVCHAIQHAHQKGIIHRDVKPSNVLVTSHDGKPVAKVIDFGVAKAIHQHLTERTIYTNFAQMIGTPLYMSPEQAEMSGLDIDTRSDIYSLGVLLYELLTGSTPLEKKRFAAAAYDEMRRIIREEEPPKPSQRLSTCDTLPSLAANRKTEPAKLSRMLKGELDWVVMKALEKDRTRRYETANGLARDIQRYLADEVVEARPPSTGYRLRKFAGKNRAALTTAAAIAVLLVAGVAVSTWQAVRATRAERIALEARQAEAERAEGERLAKLDAQANEKLAGERLVQVEDERKKAETAKVEAQAKEAEANAVVKFFQDQVFAAARPKGQDGGLGKEVSLRDAIAASEPVLDKSFTAQPLVEARLRMALGLTFSYLAEHEQARSQFERARGLYVRHLGPDHQDTLRSTYSLANSYADLNHQAEALKLREEVLAMQKRVLPKDHPDTLKTMMNLASSYAIQNRHAEALELFEEVLEIQKRVLPKDDPSTLMTMMNLASSYYNQDRLAEALKLFEGVLAIQKRVLPKDAPETLMSMVNLASSLTQAGRGAEAIALIDEFLPKSSVPGVDPRLVPYVIGLRLMHFRKAGDPAECRATAETWEKLNRTDAGSLYNAACFRSVTAAVQAKAPGADAARLAKDDADRAMAWLTKAVAAGYKDAAHMKKDTDLDSLREREDFKKLLAEVEAGKEEDKK
jgi:eukaryotic-like serine/threonine-protein kinase